MTTLPPDPHNPASPGGATPPPPQFPVPVPPQTMPYPPSGQPPKRGGLPAWAWVLIGVAAALIIGLIIAMAVLIPRIIGSLTETIEPVPVQPLPSPSDEPLSDDSLDGRYFSLDDQVDFLAGPYWAIDFQEDWTIDVWDVDGVNEMSHASSGCSLFTYQGFGVPEAEAATSDREATELTIPVALKIGIPWDANTDPEVLPDGSFDLLLDFGPDQIEMEQLRSSYSATNGEARERAILLRAFMPGNAVLLAQLDCPAGSPELSDRLDDLAVSQY